MLQCASKHWGELQSCRPTASSPSAARAAGARSSTRNLPLAASARCQAACVSLRSALQTSAAAPPGGCAASASARQCARSACASSSYATSDARISRGPPPSGSRADGSAAQPQASGTKATPLGPEAAVAAPGTEAAAEAPSRDRLAATFLAARSSTFSEPSVKVTGRPCRRRHTRPVVPRYMVRTARPRLVRVPRTWSAWRLGASCPAPLVRTARRRLVRVARTCSTEAPGRTCQHSTRPGRQPTPHPTSRTESGPLASATAAVARSQPVASARKRARSSAPDQTACPVQSGSAACSQLCVI
eukprot:scaffold2343_cov58-Phaeocystis_antarctica.AAC.3